MTDGLCRKKLKTMTFTASVTAAMSLVITLTDDVVIGQLLNEQAVGGVNLVAPFQTFTVFLTMLICCGATSCMIAEMGRFNRKGNDAYFTNGIVLSLAVGVILFAAAFILDDVYFGYLNADSVSYMYALEYFRYYPLIVLIYPIYSFLQQSIYIDGDEKLYFISYAIQFSANAVLSVVFAKWLGISGVSLGSVVATALAVVSLIPHFSGKECDLKLNFKTNVEMLRNIAENGIVGASPMLFASVLTALINRFFISSFGDEQLPVLAVAANIQGMSALLNAVGAASSPLIALYDGESNTRQLRDIISFSSRLVFISSILFSLLTVLFAPWLVKLFGITEPGLYKNALFVSRIIPISFVFTAYYNLIFSYHTSVGPLSYALYSSIVADIIVPGLLVFPLSVIIGINGLWIAFTVAPALALLLIVFPVYRRFGFVASPFLLYKENIPHVLFYKIQLTPDNIIKLQTKVSRQLSRFPISSSTKNHVDLLIEEILMLVLEKNPGKTLCAECTVIISDDITLVLKDDGILFDVTNIDLQVSSLRSYTLSQLMKYHEHRTYMTTTLCCNRNVFRLPLDT